MSSSIPWDELMDAADDSDFAPIPEGDYIVRIVTAEATKSSTDKPMWKLTCAVEGGPHDGRRVWTQQTLTRDNNNALNMFFRQMAAAGLTKDFFRTKPSNQQIADALLGRRFRAKVMIRTWNGQERNEIKGWSPADSPMGAAPPPSAAGSPTTAPPPPPSTTAPPTAPATSTAPPPPPPPPPPTTAASEPAAAAEPTGGGVATATEEGPPSGDASAWVVQQRPNTPTEDPPF